MLDAAENAYVDRGLAIKHLLKFILIDDAESLVFIVIDCFFELAHSELLMDQLNLFEQDGKTNQR